MYAHTTYKMLLDILQYKELDMSQTNVMRRDSVFGIVAEHLFHSNTQNDRKFVKRMWEVLSVSCKP